MPRADAPAAIAFRPLTEGDLDRLAGWLAAPHVARWWNDADEELTEIRAHMTSASVRPYVILMDGGPIGYLQRYDPHAEDDHPYRDQPAGTVGIDLSIGEPDLVGKGHGPRIVDAFVRRLFAEGAPRVVIDPDPRNAQAIRAYEKAGFREIDRRTSIYGDAVLMARDADTQDESFMTNISPREIVSELDRFIIGQADAKRAVSIALRNRWRRQQLTGAMREEVLPKNILMIGPTGVGKTEISRRLAKLAGAPFMKIEATKFTEVGYVGRDVESIVRDLVEVGIGLVRERRRKDVAAKAELSAEERVLTALVGPASSPATRESFRKRLREGDLDDKEIEIEVKDSGTPQFDIPGMPGGVGVVNIGEMLGKALGQRTKTKRVTVKDSFDILVNEESDKLLDQEEVTQEAIAAVENDGIVFLDEIDKITVREGRGGGDVSREGVQRDLLPLIEGTTVATKYGPVKTDHILFIASGAFHVAKPSDLLPELQGRLPIRVELHPLTKEDFVRILTETEASLIKQYIALMATEGLTLSFTPDAIEAIASFAVAINANVENIGARRLQTVMERVLDEVSFTAADQSGQTVTIDGAYVEAHIGDLARNVDLSRFIL